LLSGKKVTGGGVNGPAKGPQQAAREKDAQAPVDTIRPLLFPRRTATCETVVISPEEKGPGVESMTRAFTRNGEAQ